MSGWAGCQAWMTVAGNSKEICVTGRQGLSCVCVCVSAAQQQQPFPQLVLGEPQGR